MKYTKGPWKVCADRHNEIRTSDESNKKGGLVIAETWGNGWEETNGNAHLIAASPRMFEALQEAESYLRNKKEVKSMKGPEYGIWHRMISIIAEVKGE